MQSKPSIQMSRNDHRLWLLAVILLGAGLRLYDLGAESFWIDEVVMVNLTRGSWEALLESLARARPPLFPASGFLWVRLVGSSEFAVRFLSAMAGILAIPLLYAIGRKLFDKNVALIGAFFFSLSLFHIYHAQTYRYYAWVTLLTLASYLLFVLWLEHGGITRFFAYIIASILLFHTHTYSLFALVAQGLFFSRCMACLRRTACRMGCQPGTDCDWLCLWAAAHLLRLGRWPEIWAFSCHREYRFTTAVVAVTLYRPGQIYVLRL